MFPRDTRKRSQWWDVTETVGAFVLATVTTLGWVKPVLTWAALAVMLAYRFSAPSDKTRKKSDERSTGTKTRLVDMGKSTIRGLAKAAPIAVLFHTVGIDAPSL